MNTITLIHRYGKETESYGIALKRFVNVINSICEKDAIKITKKKNLDIVNEIISQLETLNLTQVNIYNEKNSLDLPQIIALEFSNLSFSNNVRLELIKKNYKGKAGATVRLYIINTISIEETIIDINKYKEMNFIKDNSLSFVECNCCLTNVEKY